MNIIDIFGRYAISTKSFGKGLRRELTNKQPNNNWRPNQIVICLPSNSWKKKYRIRRKKCNRFEDTSLPIWNREKFSSQLTCSNPKTTSKGRSTNYIRDRKISINQCELSKSRPCPTLMRKSKRSFS